MLTLLRNWLLWPTRTRRRAALSLAVLAALLALGGWYGWRAVRFHRERAAASQALARYDFPEARRRAAACLALRPSDPEALLLAAQAARRDGLLDEAQEYLDRHWTCVGGATPEAALQWILVRVQRGLVKEHVAGLIEQVEIRHPQSEQILEALAQGSVHIYRLEECLFWTKQLLDRYPDNPIGRLIEAQNNEELRREGRALDLARRLVEDYPENDKARLYLAGLLARGRHYDEALTHFAELHRRQPDAIAPLLGLIRTLLPLERTDEAEPLLRELEEKHAGDSEALLECARFALRQKRPADAEPLLRRAVRLAPDDHQVHYELAICLGQLGREGEAKAHRERFEKIEADLMLLAKAHTASAMHPKDLRPRREAGEICLRNGQDSEGLRWLYGALDLAPDDGPTHRMLADYFDSRGDAERAAYHRGKAR